MQATHELLCSLPSRRRCGSPSSRPTGSDRKSSRPYYALGSAVENHEKVGRVLEALSGFLWAFARSSQRLLGLRGLGSPLVEQGSRQQCLALTSTSSRQSYLNDLPIRGSRRSPSSRRLCDSPSPKPIGLDRRSSRPGRLLRNDQGILRIKHPVLWMLWGFLLASPLCGEKHLVLRGKGIRPVEQGSHQQCWESSSVFSIKPYSNYLLLVARWQQV